MTSYLSAVPVTKESIKTHKAEYSKDSDLVFFTDLYSLDRVNLNGKKIWSGIDWGDRIYLHIDDKEFNAETLDGKLVITVIDCTTNEVYACTDYKVSKTKTRSDFTTDTNAIWIWAKFKDFGNSISLSVTIWPTIGSFSWCYELSCGFQ